jgi:Fe-S-cluster containining protein
MTTKEWMSEIDRLTKEEIETSAFKPCCSKGCSHCCDEPLYVDSVEVDYMLEGLDANQLARIKERTAEWLQKVQPFLSEEPGGDGLIDAFPYRDAKITCPLLENNECMVYERRPMGCRMFFATGNPDDCRMPMRRRQRIAHISMEQPQWRGLFSRWFSDRKPGDTIMDHLGVLLANKLLGLKIKSSVRQEW